MFKGFNSQSFELVVPRIIFGGGSDVSNTLVEEVKQANSKKAIFVTDAGVKNAGLVDSMERALMDTGILTGFFDAVEQEPGIGNAELAIETVYKGGYDIVVGVGGGSVLDVAKTAAAMGRSGRSIRDCLGVDNIPEKGLPLVLIPTTAGTGSEVTGIAVLKERGKGKENRSVVIFSKYLRADLAIVDPTLLTSLPAKITAYTGMDALTHAIEAYTCTVANPVSNMFALEAIKLLAGNLRVAVIRGEDIKARSNTMLGSAFAGVAFANSGLGATHALAYPFGIKYGMAHGLANGIMLPWVMKHNYPASVPAYAKIAQAMNVRGPVGSVQGALLREALVREDAKEAVRAVRDLAIDIGIPHRLKEVGVKREELAEFADLALKYSAHLLKVNPRVYTKKEIVKVYEDAFNGNWTF